MTVLLSAAGVFVYWRVEIALDRSLTNDLTSHADELRSALAAHPGQPQDALASLRSSGVLDQVLDLRGSVRARTADATGPALLRRRDLVGARTHPVGYEAGHLLLDDDHRLRVLAFPVTTGTGRPELIAVTAVGLAQRDEALRELLAQLAVANLSALAVASLVGYRLARAALLPVERYRSRAEQIALGATGLRLDVPTGTDDEVTRLGHTLNQMLAAQDGAAARQRQFLADASHELRAPLTLLTSEVELALRRPRSPAELEQTLRHVAEDTTRLVRLADQLLELERATAGQPSVAVADADLAAAVQRAARWATHALTETGRQVHLGPGAQVQVDASPEQLDLVLGNLVDNAIIHGAGTVQIAASLSGSAVRVIVQDDGAGLDAAFVPHATERFRRAERSRTTPGNGLGLAVVHTVLAGVGGDLWLCSHSTHYRYPPAQHAQVSCGHGPSQPSGTVLTAVLRLTTAKTPRVEGRERGSALLGEGLGPVPDLARRGGVEEPEGRSPRYRHPAT